MSAGMFVMQDDKTLVPLSTAEYEAEALLQSLIADYPELLPGDQMGTDEPRRWLLVGREFGVPGELAGSDRWSLDHLLLDQDGIPTLVEVKRSSDTRIRREVVAQMLDYAANILAYAPVERVRERFFETCRAQDADPDIVLAERLGVQHEDEFWGMVKRNLEAGAVRMLFVADIIPPELRRIVEYLNAQMNSAEVLAVEIRQFRGPGLRALVPAVLGNTERARQAKAAGGTRGETWTEARFFAKMAEAAPSSVPLARAILAWADTLATRFPGSYVLWGSGKTQGSFYPVIVSRGRRFVFPGVWSQGYLELTFQYLREAVPYADSASRQALADEFRALGLIIPADRQDKRPSVRPTPDMQAAILRILHAYADRIAASS